MNQQPVAFWSLKPWWCQPWSIVLTGRCHGSLGSWQCSFIDFGSRFPSPWQFWPGGCCFWCLCPLRIEGKRRFNPSLNPITTLGGEFASLKCVGVFTFKAPSCIGFKQRWSPDGIQDHGLGSVRRLPASDQNHGLDCEHAVLGPKHPHALRWGVLAWRAVGATGDSIAFPAELSGVCRSDPGSPC